jgi:hypothetical protein
VRIPTEKQIARACSVLRAVRSEARSEASRRNGRSGGRPQTPIEELCDHKPDCQDGWHPWSCRARRAIETRERKEQ